MLYNMRDVPPPAADPLLDEEDCDDDSDGDGHDDIDPPVYQVDCKHCNNTLTRRGMSVFLIADPSKSLFSTDIPTDGLREQGEPRNIETCGCLIRRLECARRQMGRFGVEAPTSTKTGEPLPRNESSFCQSCRLLLRRRCSGCSADVGYHVTQPCDICILHEHNGHFWLFAAAHVSAARRYVGSPAASASGEAGRDGVGGRGPDIGAGGGGTPLLWSRLAYNGVEGPDEEEGGGSAQEEEEEEGAEGPEGGRCPICFCAIRQRTQLPTCGHEFCFGCISRGRG